MGLGDDGRSECERAAGIESGDLYIEILDHGDGNADFVVGNFPVFGQKEGNITVFLSNGKGALSPGVNYGSKA